MKDRVVTHDHVEVHDRVDDMLDDTEGAGLGLIMAMILFKSVGLPPGSFKIKSSKGKVNTLFQLGNDEA